MKIGFIGAGKAGCNLGKYLSLKAEQADVQVTGYYSLYEEEAKWAARFTESRFYDSIDDLILASDSVILSTPDGAIKDVWNAMNKEVVKDKVICHLSGSLSSDVFSGIEEYGAYPISIHPMFAFSSKDSVYLELNQASFTLEGHFSAVEAWKKVFEHTGNAAIMIKKEVKPKYHAAASILSNHVIAVLATGYSLLEDCGFSEEQARSFSQVLVQNNVSHVISSGVIPALTGPIERGDVETVKKHLEQLDENEKELYITCAKKLVDIAKQKNPDRDYMQMMNLLR